LTERPTEKRPAGSEHAPYHHLYIDRVPHGDIVDTLEKQLESTLSILANVDEQKALYRYAPGKWSLKEVVGHVVDTERIFAYRALRFARGDDTPLPGVEQDDLVARAGFDRRTLASIVEEFRHLRQSNTALFRSFDEGALSCAGTASGMQVSVRALLFIIAGHELHHMAVIRERYLA
jgi:uncharacterized damage-inducible protein DinB